MEAMEVCGEDEDEEGTFKANDDACSTSIKKNHHRKGSDVPRECPCCKSVKKLSKTIGHRGISVAICAYFPVAYQLSCAQVGSDEHNPYQCFAVCSMCSLVSSKAVEYAERTFSDCSAFKLSKRSNLRATLLPRAINCGTDVSSLVRLYIFKVR